MLYVIAIGSLAWAVAPLIFGDIFLSPARFALLVALPVLVGVTALVLPLIDLTPVFERQGSPLRLFDAHYSVEGNALVAKTFVSALESGLPSN